MDVKRRDIVRRLMDEVREIAASPRNQERVELWQTEEDTARDHWRGKPRSSLEVEFIPFTIEPEIPMWGEILGFDVCEYYTDPFVYLVNQLRMLTYRFENFSDSTVIGKDIPIWLGTTLESSLFGAKTIFRENESPWLDRQPVFASRADLEKAQPPDFFTSGLMPTAHRFYTEIRELLEPDFGVIFPEWGRSPFGVAFHTRGHDNLLTDLCLDPSFAHRLLRFITDCRKDFVRARARFLGEPIPKGNLYNDEVNTPTLSPELTSEFVVPYEAELSEFHGGISYWHSCGDTTKLVDILKAIPSIEMFHVGPWTDVSAVKRAFGDSVALEICLHPVRDVQEATIEEMKTRLRQIITDAYGSPFTIRGDGFHVIGSLDSDLRKLREWVDAANEVCRETLMSLRKAG